MRFLLLAVLLLAGCGPAMRRGPTAGASADKTAFGRNSSHRLLVLDGRLSVEVPQGAGRRTPPHDLMAAPEPDAVESIVWMQRAGQRFLLIFRDEFLRCGSDFNATLDALFDSGEEERPPAPYDRRSATLAGGIQLIALVPRSPERQGDVASVLQAGICHPDGTVQFARAMVGGADLDALIRRGRSRALRMLASLRVGPARRPSGARTLKLATYSGHPLQARVPDGWIAYVQEGPDFRVQYLKRLADRPSARASVGIYLGDAPSWFGGQAGTAVPGTFLGRSIEWYKSADNGWVRIQAVVARPDLTGTRVVHAFAGATDDAGLSQARAILESVSP